MASITAVVMVSREITAPANYRNAGPLTHSHIPNLPDLCVTDVVMSDAKF